MAPQKPATKKTVGRPKSTPKTKLSETAGVAKSQKKRESTTCIFGPSLPSHRLRFPSSGNVTAAEQVVFLTESGLRSHDALDRLLQHGMNTELLCFKINHSRKFVKYPIKHNSVGTMIRGIMREHGHINWTMVGHQAGRFPDTTRAPDNLTMTGLQLHCEQFPAKRGNQAGPVDHIPFENLAIDVTRFPEGDDAMELTACITWAVNNPGSGLLYPRDYQWLTTQLGGPRVVLLQNQDGAAFTRWRNAKVLWKDAVAQARSKVKKAERLCKTLKSEGGRARHAAALVTAQLELDALVSPPPAIATVVNGTLVIDNRRVPVSIPGPSKKAVADYLASFTPRLAPVVNLQPPAVPELLSSAPQISRQPSASFNTMQPSARPVLISFGSSAQYLVGASPGHIKSSPGTPVDVIFAPDNLTAKSSEDSGKINNFSGSNGYQYSMFSDLPPISEDFMPIFGDTEDFQGFEC